MDHTPFRLHLGGVRRAALALAALLFAAPALAAPIAVTLQFTGTDGFGVSETDALASGLPRIPLGPSQLVQDAAGLDTTRMLDLSTFQAGPPATVSSDWAVTNTTGRDLLGDLYLVFAKPLANEIDLGDRTEMVDYDPSDVGLVLRNGTGGLDWVLIEASDGADTLYYPAVSLESLLMDATSESFQLDYVLLDPEIFQNADFELQPGIPQWQLLAGFIPIPEPSTALLVAGGLAGLAAGRRRRS